MTGIAAIVLAAGRGTRFGEAPKLLADLDGKPVIQHVAEAALASSLDPVILVSGHRRPEIEAALDGLPLQLAFNPAFADGLSTSLRTGFAALPPERAAMVLLGDMPRVKPTLIDRLAAAWRGAGGPAALVPVHDGRRGNPVVLSHLLAPEVARLAGDAGAGPLLRGRDDVVLWPADDPAVLQDVDTAAALDALRG
ncbi:MAG TPA: nucleotidyltransferase family protein [Microvirga sp.]|jgi:molybdenum cofactor cytidylyltransferase|nr:nucleotidyltransferase family protein [Microvirga sp.]